LPSGFQALSRLNPGVCVIVLGFWPIAGLLLHQRRRGLSAAGLFVVIGVLVWLPAGAAAASFVAGLVVFAAVAWAGKAPIRLVGGSAAALIVAAPLLVGSLQAMGSGQALFDSIPPSWQHRMYIWEFAAERIAERPLTGWGFDASRRIPGGNAPVPVGSEVMPLHPHNAALQIWMELGLPGAMAAAALVWFLSEAIVRKRQPGYDQAASAAALTVYLVIAATAYGVWQYWWHAAAWFLAAALAVTTGPDRSPPQRSWKRQATQAVVGEPGKKPDGKAETPSERQPTIAESPQAAGKNKK
jgi:O-antigen ligase